MSRIIGSKPAVGAVMAAVLLLAVPAAMAQMRSAVVGSASAGADILRIRKSLQAMKEKTPSFKTDRSSSAPSMGKDWWRGVIEFDTAAEWIDELEFTYYVYIEDASNNNSPVMFRSVVTYVNIPKGNKHLSDCFLHPDTVKRMGIPKFVAVVVKYRGAVIAAESTAQKANWWDNFAPVDGVLLNRAQTPFALLEYDLYPCIKPAVSASR